MSTNDYEAIALEPSANRDTLKGVILALRPWSFTASAIPVLLACQYKGLLLTASAGKLLAMVILSQSGANLVNTYFDYVNKIDTKELSGDPSIIGGNISPRWAGVIAVVCFLLSAVPAIDFLVHVPDFRWVFAAGTALGYLYTGWPFALKYHCMGDLCIILAFGPVAVQSCSLALTGEMDNFLNALCVPAAMLTEGILWANNARDIDADSKAGITTLCHFTGFARSRWIYDLLVYGAYLACVLLSVVRWAPGLLLPLVTLPLGVKTCAGYIEGRDTMLEQPDRTAQLHLPFGLMMLIGLVVDAHFFGK